MPREIRNPLRPIYGIFYDGHKLPNIHRKELSEEVIYDNEQRTIRYRRYILEVEFVLTPGDFYSSFNIDSLLSADDAVGYFRNILMVPGKTLVLDNCGLGSSALIITGMPLSSPETASLNFMDRHVPVVADALNGPTPISFVARPIASNNAIFCKWVCQFNLHEGSILYDGLNYGLPFTMFRYKTFLSFNSDGGLVRKVEGEFEVPGNVPRNNVTPDRAMAAVYNRIPFLGRLKGFHRRQELTISEDFRNVRFTIEDTEIPSDNPLYPYAVNIEASHTVRTKLLTSGSISDPGGFTKWLNVIDMTIRLRPGGMPGTVGRFGAWLAFVWVLNERLKTIGDRVMKFDPPKKADPSQQDSRDALERAFILETTLREDIFDRTFHFTVNYMVLSSPKNILKTSRLFYPLEDNSWDVWEASMLGTTLKPSRRSQFSYAWSPPYIPSPGGAGDVLDITNDTPPVAVNPEPSIGEFFAYKLPPPELSYGAFDSSIEVTEQTQNVLHSRNLPQSESHYSSPQVDGPARAAMQGWEIENFADNPSQTPAEERHVLQNRGKNTYDVRLRGYAVRVGYPVPMPRLAKFGSQLAYRKPGSRWMQKQVGVSSNGIPIFLGAWDVLYTIEGDPSSGGDLMEELATANEAARINFLA